MITERQKQLLNLRKTHNQVEIARIFNTTQANISKIENTIKKNIKRSIEFINYCGYENILLLARLKSNPLENAIFILPFFKKNYEVTGVTAQYLLLNYYKITNEVEIRALEKEFHKLWGCKVILEEAGPLYQVKEGITLAINEKIITDCLKRDDTAGVKSAVAMILVFKMDYSILNLLMNEKLQETFDLLIDSINKSLQDYGFEKEISFLKKEGKKGLKYQELVDKVLDDFAPFLEERKVEF